MTCRLPAVFIGYGGRQGQTIAQDVHRYFRRRRVNAFVVTPENKDSIRFLESEEKILETLPRFKLAVMVCTAGAIHSRRFRDETEKLVYDLKVPTVAFAMRGAPILNVLKLRTRVCFARNRHKKACKELFSTLRKLRMSK